MNRVLVKAEAAFYGKFVDAAYEMFKRDRTNLEPQPQPGDIPAPFELVAWIKMSDFAFDNEIAKFYGLIARDTTQKHSFILAIRGTEGWVEWLDDAMVHLIPFRQVPDAGRVAFGFDKIYATLQVKHRPQPGNAAEALVAQQPLTGSFAEQIEQLADRLEDAPTQQAIRADATKRPRRSFVVTGHSLGSALATLFVMENKAKKKFDITSCCTFASPHVGNTEFVHFFDQLPITSWRIANNQDIVTKIPFRIPLLFDYEHVETLYEFTSKGVVKWN